MLASGAGSLLQALLDAAANPSYPADVAAVLVDRDCAATERAQRAGVQASTVRLGDYGGRPAWDAALAAAAAAYRPDYVVSAGFMKIVGPVFLTRFDGRIVNTHPALLPAFPGAHAVRDALAYGVKVTGSTVHIVDAGVDTGPILAQEPVTVEPGDDEPALHERIKNVERRLLVEVVSAIAARGVSIDGRKAVIL